MITNAGSSLADSSLRPPPMPGAGRAEGGIYVVEDREASLTDSTTTETDSEEHIAEVVYHRLAVKGNRPVRATALVPWAGAEAHAGAPRSRGRDCSARRDGLQHAPAEESAIKSANGSAAGSPSLQAAR